MTSENCVIISVDSRKVYVEIVYCLSWDKVQNTRKAYEIQTVSGISTGNIRVDWKLNAFSVRSREVKATHYFIYPT